MSKHIPHDQNLELSHTPDARSLAVQVLLHVSPATHLQASLDKGLRNTTLPSIDHGLCTELVYGTMRYALRLDAVLDTLMKKRKALPAEMQMVMRVASYALLFLDRVPHHATVNWAVNFVKGRFGQPLSKVCNGTLRSLIRLEDQPYKLSFFSKQEDFYSMPAWLFAMLKDNYGQEDAQRICERSLARPKIALRLNPRHAKFAFLQEQLESLGAEKVGWSGYVFDTISVPREIDGQSMAKLHDAGAFSWQASGSQHVLQSCFAAVPDLKFSPLWDACAGQGGKSLALLEQGLEVSICTDTSKSRLMLLQETARRLKVPCPHVVCADASKYLLNSWQGNILLDVPCSGFGTLSRRPEIRVHRSQNDVSNLIGLQKKILRTAFASLQAGQYVIYMTCTLHPLENEKLVAKFLEEQPMATQVYTWQTAHEHAYMEGMYVSVIKKNS